MPTGWLLMALARPSAASSCAAYSAPNGSMRRRWRSTSRKLTLPRCSRKRTVWSSTRSMPAIICASPRLCGVHEGGREGAVEGQLRVDEPREAEQDVVSVHRPRRREVGRAVESHRTAQGEGEAVGVRRHLPGRGQRRLQPRRAALVGHQAVEDLVRDVAGGAAVPERGVEAFGAGVGAEDQRLVAGAGGLEAGQRDQRPDGRQGPAPPEKPLAVQHRPIIAASHLQPGTRQAARGVVARHPPKEEGRICDTPTFGATLQAFIQVKDAVLGGQS